MLSTFIITTTTTIIIIITAPGGGGAGVVVVVCHSRPCPVLFNHPLNAIVLHEHPFSIFGDVVWNFDDLERHRLISCCAVQSDGFDDLDQQGIIARDAGVDDDFLGHYYYYSGDE
jgi:hypothetical protein